MCLCDRCKTLGSVPRAELVDLLDQQVHSEAVDTLTTRDHYRDAAVALGAKLDALDDFVRLSFELFAYQHMSGRTLNNEVRERLRAKYTEPDGRKEE